MSIKPIDFQVMLPKTSEASNLYNDRQHRHNALQQQQAITVQNKAENSLKQVNAQDKAHEGKIKEKQEKNGNKKRDGKKGNTGSGKDSRENKDFHSTVRTSTIDIRL